MWQVLLIAWEKSFVTVCQLEWLLVLNVFSLPLAELLVKDVLSNGDEIQQRPMFAYSEERCKVELKYMVVVDQQFKCEHVRDNTSELCGTCTNQNTMPLRRVGGMCVCCADWHWIEASRQSMLQSLWPPRRNAGTSWNSIPGLLVVRGSNVGGAESDILRCSCDIYTLAVNMRACVFVLHSTLFHKP